MLTDYKFWYIKRDDNGFITECTVRFYEGEIQKKVYVRTKRLQSKDLSHLSKDIKGKMGLEITKEIDGNDVVGYTSKDFGEIKTDDELRLFLNKELAKDKSREPVDEQKWQH